MISNTFGFPQPLEGKPAGIHKMKKDEKKFVTTGEAAKLLAVSLSTAMRFFDKGILTGEKHPITGFRRIDMESIISLMEKYGMKMSE